MSDKAVLRLKWAQNKCRRCSATRTVGQPCPTCGARPAVHEVDPKLQSRQRLVRRVREALDGTPGPPKPNSAAAFDRLASWLPRFLAAIASALKDGDDGSSAVRVSGELAEIRVLVEPEPRRPDVLLHRTGSAALEAVAASAGLWLDALAAGEPMLAQQFGVRAQAQIDAAEEMAARLARVQERRRQIEEQGSIAEVLAVILRELAPQAGPTGLYAEERRLAGIYSRVLGEPIPVGFGVGLEIENLIAEALLDVEAFRTTMRRARDVLRSDEVKLRALLDSPPLAADVREAEASALWAHTAAQGALAAVRTDEQSIRTLVDLALKLMEGPGRRYLAVLTAMTRPDGYPRRRALDAGQLIREAVKDVPDLAEPFDVVIRNKGAHLDYVIEGDVVVLLENGRRDEDARQIKVIDLVDRILHLTETCAAIGIALHIVAANEGVDLGSGSAAFSELGVEGLDGLRLLMQIAGVVVDDINVDHDVLVLRAPTAAPTKVPVAILTAATHLPIDVTTVMVDTDSGRVTGPAAAAKRETSGASPKEWALLELMATWTLDGRPFRSADQVARYIVGLVDEVERDAGAPLTAIPRLREIRRLAERVGLMPDLDAYFTRALKAARERLAGEPESLGLPPLRASSGVRHQARLI